MFNTSSLQMTSHFSSAYIMVPLRIEIVKIHFAPPVPETGQHHNPARSTNILAVIAALITALDHERHQQIRQEEVAKVVGGHVQLQVVLRHVLLGQGDPGVQNQNVQSGKKGERETRE